MSYIICATWLARAGSEESVLEALKKVAPLSRQEPGVLQYIVHRSQEEPRRFFLYEEYRDEAAFQSHLESDHFKKYVLEEALPHLESRRREHFSIAL